RDPADELAQFGDECIRLKAANSAGAVREFNNFVRRRCAVAVLEALGKAGYAVRNDVIEECARSVETAIDDEQDRTFLSSVVRALKERIA
ncbi:hypothetical protein ACKI1Q_44400, partial [Streptomyces galilaeus]|uniref:hypothetical protein n=1 Tax=Streptomyces galilaeus TaxID=33899 RepID=UPI0038F7E26B